MSKKKVNEIQTLTLVFEDGTEATFSGPAVCQEGETKRIVEAHFGKPMPLPKDCFWSDLKN